MHAVLGRIRANATFRPALVAPILIMIVFSFFNLTSAPDQARVPAAMTLGVVNLDQGVPFVPVKLSDQLLQRLGSALPFAVATYPDEAAARAALDAGAATAILVLPADFSLKAMGRDPLTVKVLNSQHRSMAETQFGGTLPQLFQANLSAAIASLRLAAAQGALPAAPAAGETPALTLPVTVETETLHQAANAAALLAPFVMTFATWIAGLVGALMLFIATRTERGPGSALPVATIRTLLPLPVTLAASLLLSLVVAWTADAWPHFLALWGISWLGALAATLLVTGLLAVFSFWALVVVLPAVFYQGALAGAQMPLAAAPDWLQRVGEVLPFADLAASYRAILIGGPEGSVALPTLALAAALGIVLIWAGTLLYGLLRRAPVPRHA